MSEFRFQPLHWIARLLAPLDGPLVTIVLAILCFSTIVMVSASPERLDTLALNIAVAFAVMWIAASIPPQRMMTVALPLYVLGVLLLIGVALFGDVSKGAQSGGPCVLEPETGSLIPNNWLRPRFRFRPAAGQSVFEIRMQVRNQIAAASSHRSAPEW